MTQYETLNEALSDALPLLDSLLADREVAIPDRPGLAAIHFLRLHVEFVDDGGGPQPVPLDARELLSKKWFATLYQLSEQWFEARYPGRTSHPSNATIQGAVLIEGTVFLIEVPKTRLSLDSEPGHAWLSFPSSVLNDENPIEWLENPPNLNTFSDKEAEAASKKLLEISSKLRYISTGLMWTLPTDDIDMGLISGIIPKIENAAEFLFESDKSSLGFSVSEMQYSCESVLKLLSYQQRMEFRKSHDLFVLFDDLAVKPNINRDVLKEFPRWRDIANFRYGLGSDTTLAKTYKWYQITLDILIGSIHTLKKSVEGHPEFKLRSSPFKF